MKKIISVLLLLGQIAIAGVIEVNNDEKKVYVYSTPTFQIETVDAETDGGVIFFFLEYDSAATRAELTAIQTQYPNHSVQLVTSEGGGSLKLEIPEIGFSETLGLRQGQLGPYLNANYQLTAQQMTKFKSLASKIQSSLVLTIPSKVGYMSVQTLETYSADATICDQFRAKSVKDVLLGLGNLKKSDQIRYDQTFQALKNEVLNQCFQIGNSQVGSFKEMMDLNVTTLRPSRPLVARAAAKVDMTKSVSIKPFVKIVTK